MFALLSTAAAVGQDRASPPPATPVIGDDLDPESLRAAIHESLRFLAKLPAERIVGRAPRPFSAGEVTETLRAFLGTLERRDCRECWLREIQERFDLVPSSAEAPARDLLVTGYYQPVLDASLSPTAAFRFPIYGRPADLVQRQTGPDGVKRTGRLHRGTLVPYHTRADIDGKGALRGRGYELAWLRDPVDVFFMHIQGSAALRLPDGSRMQVGYAGANGRPYRSIGRRLIDDGRIPAEEMSMQRLRRYLAEHPEDRDEILEYNESYVFFRFVETGPLGNLEVPVTAGRSIATDLSLFPKGALALMYSERPVLGIGGALRGWTPFLRFVLNQDTGGAIRGPRRVDLFFGAGDQSGAGAGFMQSPGKLFFLALKNPRTGGR